MKCISGTNWGYSKDTLITIYKALILSRFDYCCSTYYQACNTLLKKLDSIEYRALMIAVGGFQGTALNALLGECGELPLSLRRQNITIKYLLKITNATNNIASQVLQDNKFPQLNLKNSSKYKTLLNSFLTDLEIQIEDKAHGLISNPPWINYNDLVDLSLLTLRSTIKDESVLSVHYANKLSEINIKHTNILFTDGSVDSEGKVGTALLFPSQSTNFLFHLPTGLSIYCAEAVAMLKTFLYVQDINLSSFCIISDCASVLNDIATGNVKSSPHPTIISKICDLLATLPSDHNFCLLWYPAHQKIPTP